MKQYNLVTTLSDQDLKEAYKELTLDKLPASTQSVVRVLQVDISKEQGKTIALTTIKYKIAMEYIKRFIKE